MIRKTSKIDKAQQRLQLEIAKQEYEIKKDLLDIRMKYHPVSMGANFVSSLLSEEEGGTATHPMPKQLKRLRSIAQSLLMIADSYLDSVAVTLAEEAQSRQTDEAEKKEDKNIDNELDTDN